MNRRKFVSWLVKLPASVWMLGTWYVPSGPRRIEIVFVEGKIGPEGETWRELTPKEAQKIFQYFRPYSANGSFEESFRDIDRLAE